MVLYKSEKTTKPIKPKLMIDRLRQKNRPPRKIRELVGDDTKCMDFFPSWGMGELGVQALPLSEEAERTYLRRKERGSEAKLMGTEGMGTGTVRVPNVKKNPPTSGTPLPIPRLATAPLAPEIPTTHFTILSGEHAALPSVPQEMYHVWSIHSPSAPAVQVEQHTSTAPAYSTSHDASYYPPLIPTSAPAPHVVSGHYTDDNVQLHFPSVTMVVSSASPEPTYAPTRGGHATRYIPTTVDLKTDNASSSPSPPAAWTEYATANSVPPYAAIKFESESRDTAYRDFFVCPMPPDSHCSSTQPPAPPLSGHYVDMPQQVANGLAPQACSTASTSIHGNFCMASSDNIVTGEEGFGDMREVPAPTYAAQPGGGESIAWSTPPAVVAHTDRERSDYAANHAYVYGYDTQVQSPPAQQAAFNIHPATPTLHSSYSELAQALHCTPRPFTNGCTLSSVDSQTATALPAAPDTSLGIYPSGGRVALPGLLPPAPSHSQEVPFCEDDYARIFRNCIDRDDRLLSKTQSLLLDMGFATDEWGALVRLTE